MAELDAEIAATAERLAGTTLQVRWLFGFPDYLGQLNDASPVGALLTEMGLPTLPAQRPTARPRTRSSPSSSATRSRAPTASSSSTSRTRPATARRCSRSRGCTRLAPAVAAGRVVRLGVAESNAAYFDSVLTVRGNLALIERVLGELQA